MILNRSFTGQIVNAGFQYVAPALDLTPDTIQGQAIPNAQLTTDTEFDPVQITGIDAEITASITGGQFRVSVDGQNWGAYSSVDQPVNNNYWIQVQATSSETHSDPVTATLSAGGESTSFVVQTSGAIGVIVIPETYLSAKSVVTVTKAKRSQAFHDGTGVPEADPKDPNSDVWYQFELLGFEEDEAILTASVLIDGVLVGNGQEHNGLVFVELQSDGVNLAKVRLKGGNLGQKYRVSIRYSTPYVPSDDRSQDITIVQL